MIGDRSVTPQGTLDSPQTANNSGYHGHASLGASQVPNKDCKMPLSTGLI